MGRLSLPRVSRRRRGGPAQPPRPSAGPLLPRGRRGAPRPARARAPPVPVDDRTPDRADGAREDVGFARAPRVRAARPRPHLRPDEGLRPALARRLAAEAPDLVTDRIDRHGRRGRVYFDWIQHDASRSTVAAYSLRATPWPLVSTPIAWEELEAAVARARPRELVFGPRDVLARVDQFRDLSASLADPTSGVRLPVADAPDRAPAHPQNDR